MDLALFLAVLMTFIIGAYVAYPKVENAHRATVLAQRLDTLANKVDTALINRWDTTSAINAGILTPDWLPSGHGSPIDPWGDAVTLSSLPHGDGVQITLSAMPSEGCVAMMRHVPIAWNEVRIDRRSMANEHDRQVACQTPPNVPKTVTFVHQTGQSLPLPIPMNRPEQPSPEA